MCSNRLTQLTDGFLLQPLTWQMGAVNSFPWCSIDMRRRREQAQWPSPCQLHLKSDRQETKQVREGGDPAFRSTLPSQKPDVEHVPPRGSRHGKCNVVLIIYIPRDQKPVLFFLYVKLRAHIRTRLGTVELSGEKGTNKDLLYR